MKTEIFKRGQRVRFVDPANSYLHNRLGTITGRDSRGWMRVRFDYQQTYEKGIQCSERYLEPYDGSDRQDDLRKYECALTRKQWEAIAAAMRGGIIASDERREILAAIPFDMRGLS